MILLACCSNLWTPLGHGTKTWLKPEQSVSFHQLIEGKICMYHHLPSSTYIWGWKILFPSKFPLNKYNDWKHRGLFRKTQDQSRSAAWGLLGLLPEKKTQRHVAMWVLYGEKKNVYHHLIAPWMVVNILALGYENHPPKKNIYLDVYCVEILWNPLFCVFKCIYIYMYVSKYVCTYVRW